MIEKHAFISYEHLFPNILIPLPVLFQGRPVRVLHDASMHHGQNRRKQKTRKLDKNT